ncbi:hypothetical protein [Dactylosporangium sp. CA-139066]|uniref:hypothetical protein n=1 Tax=Dactylosporangium sp. CA-139066 TaxID=3239930 RepID=UPI003D8D4A42
MDIDLNDPTQVLLGELRYFADVRPRWRAVLPDHGPVKGVNEADARHLAAQYGGRAERSEVWLLDGGWEVLAPWRPAAPEEAAADGT